MKAEINGTTIKFFFLFCIVITIVLLFLKGIGKIGMSWLWVVSPLWVPFAIVVALIVLAAIVFLIIIVISELLTKREIKNICVCSVCGSPIHPESADKSGKGYCSKLCKNQW